MALDYLVNMKHVDGKLGEGQLVLLKLDGSRSLSDGRMTPYGLGKVVESGTDHAVLEIDGYGRVKALRPTYDSSHVAKYPTRELEAVAVNTLASDDPDVVFEYLSRLAGGQWQSAPVVVHVTSVGEHGIKGRLIGENSGATWDRPGTEEPSTAIGDIQKSRQHDDLRLEEDTPYNLVGVVSMGGAEITDELPVFLNGRGIDVGGAEQDIAVETGDLLIATDFGIEIKEDIPIARVIQVAKIGSASSLEEAVALLNLSERRETTAWFAKTLASRDHFYRASDIAIAHTEPDMALALFYVDPCGERQMHLLGSSGYAAYVNDELATYLEHDGLEPGLWVMDNVENVSWRNGDDDYDADVEGDWRPATTEDVENLFGPVDLADADLAHVMEIDPEPGLVGQYIEKARIALFEERFDTEHRQFARHRFGANGDPNWTAYQIVNPEEIDEFAEAAFSDIRDERLRHQMTAILRKSIKARSTLFSNVSPTDDERAVLAKETNWGNRKPIQFNPDIALEQDRKEFREAVLRNERTLLQQIERGQNLSAFGLTQIMRRLNPGTLSKAELKPFSEGRATGGEWKVVGTEGKWLTLALFKEDRQIATLVTSGHTHRLTTSAGNNIFSTSYNFTEGLAKNSIDVEKVLLDADRALCEYEARLLLSNRPGWLSSVAENGIHSVGRETFHIEDGVLHRTDGPAFTRSPMFEGDATYEEYRFRGNLHRDDGPALIEGDSEVWYRHGLEHRDNGPSTVIGDTREFRQYDRLHREDGPAIDGPDGRHWYINGQAHREHGPARIVGSSETYMRRGRRHRPDGPAEVSETAVAYYVSGRLHHEDGPAFVPEEGTPVYAIHGEEIDEAEFLSRSQKPEQMQAPKP